jgi:tetratricopeptide (TPR) repeat protein
MMKMITKDSTICMVLRSPEELSFFTTVFKQFGYGNITGFHNSAEAYEVIIRKQYDLFVVRAEMPELSGTAMIQKMRSAGNYGLETHLFIADRVDQHIFNILLEHDIGYVLVKPFTPERIQNKFEYLCNIENNLSQDEIDYRNAKAAFHGEQYDMAHHIATQLASRQKICDKVQTLLGDIELKRDNIRASRQHYETAMKNSAHAPAAAHKIAETYMKEGNFELATKILDAQAQINPLNIKLLINAGISHLEIGNTDKAKDYMHSVQQQDAHNKESGEVLAAVHTKERNYEKIADALILTHTGEDLIIALNNYGVNLSQDNNAEGALAMYRRCIEVIEDTKFFHVIYYNMATAYRKIGDMAKTRECLKKALEVNPAFEKAQKALEAAG